MLSSVYLIKTRVTKHLPFELKYFSIDSEIATYIVDKVTEVCIKHRHRRRSSKKLSEVQESLILREISRLRTP